MLLAGVTGETAKETAGASDGARAYDLSSPDGSCAWTLELQRAFRSPDAPCAAELHASRSADITVGSIKIQKYADFERNLPCPAI